MKDLAEFLSPDLVLTVGGQTYSVKPPTRDTGIKMAAIVAMGMSSYAAGTQICPTCHRTGEIELDQETRDLLASIKDVPLGRITLGDEVFDQMEADGMPEDHQDRIAQYALYYWTLGEAAADATFESAYGKALVEAGPKASKSGRSMASDHRTKTGSTAGTKRRRN